MQRPFELSPEAAALLERLNQARRLNGITIAQIAAALGTYQTTVTNQLNGKHALDVRVLLAISTMCPDISSDWLLRGKGDIIRKPDMT